MKKVCMYLFGLILLTGCSSFDFGGGGSNKIGGSTDLPINTVGTTFQTWVSLPGTFYTGETSVSVTKVEEGVITVNFKATLPTNQPLLTEIKSKYKDAEGNLDCEATFKITDEGILDYNNIDHEPFVLVKFDAKVGDKYKLKKSDGTVITREVVRVSSEDDLYWNGLLIKTIDVEQDSRIPGVDKLIYFTNHKFGIVAIRAELEDGTKSIVELYPSAYLK